MPVSMNNTQVVFNDATTQTTAGYPATNPNGYTSNTGTVTSVATGNGLQGGTITTTGTLSVACPTFNTVGSYALGTTDLSVSPGSNYSGGSAVASSIVPTRLYDVGGTATIDSNNSLSGTWKWMAADLGASIRKVGLVCRVS